LAASPHNVIQDAPPSRSNFVTKQVPQITKVQHTPPLRASTSQQLSPNISEFATTQSSHSHHDCISLRRINSRPDAQSHPHGHRWGANYASLKALEKELVANLMAIPCPWGHNKGHLGLLQDPAIYLQ
jgi:hypothetical protein